jgi:hypothetical protein
MTPVLEEEVRKRLDQLVQRVCDLDSACLFVNRYLAELEKTRGMTGDPAMDAMGREARRRMFAPMHAELDKVLAKGPLFPRSDREKGE